MRHCPHWLTAAQCCGLSWQQAFRLPVVTVFVQLDRRSSTVYVSGAPTNAIVADRLLKPSWESVGADLLGNMFWHSKFLHRQNRLRVAECRGPFRLPRRQRTFFESKGTVDHVHEVLHHQCLHPPRCSAWPCFRRKTRPIGRLFETRTVWPGIEAGPHPWRSFFLIRNHPPSR